MKKAYDLRERVTERERMYIESQYALQQLRSAQGAGILQALCGHLSARCRRMEQPRATVYQTIGELRSRPLAGFEKTWEIAKWDNIAADNAGRNA
jgi:hypothetical protein